MEFSENKAGIDKESIGENKGEIVVYQPDEVTRLEVRLKDDSVWLNRQQIAKLFSRDIKTIGKHINNALNEELFGLAVVAKFATTATDGKTYIVEYYNLEMILSIGYRVKSPKGIVFRRWANTVLKEYLIKGHSFNARLLQLSADIDRRMETHARTLCQHEHLLEDHSKKIDFFIRSSLPPKQGIFFDGQIYDAYSFVADLVRKAARRIVLIDNYIDDTVLTFSKAHDRFLIIDDTVYLVGASIKDLGKKWFGFTLMENTDAEELMKRL